VKHPKLVRGKTWVGLWADGTLGWQVGDVAEKYRGLLPDGADKNWPGFHSRFYLCRVTIEPILNSKGSPIMRRPWKGHEHIDGEENDQT